MPVIPRLFNPSGPSKSSSSNSSSSAAAAYRNYSYTAIMPAHDHDHDHHHGHSRSDITTTTTTITADPPTSSSSNKALDPDLPPSYADENTDENTDENAEENQKIAPTATETEDAATATGLVTGGGEEYRVYKRRFLGLGVLMALNIVISWGWLTFAPVADSAATWFSLSSQTPVNWLSTVIFFSFVVASPAVIYTLSTPNGLKHTILLSSLLVLAGNWIRYAGTVRKNFGVVMLGQIFIGFAQPFALNAPASYSETWFSSRGRISATAVASLSNPFGAALGQLINPFLCTKPGQVPSMVLWVAVISTVACIPWFFVTAKPPTPPSPAAELNLRAGSRSGAGAGAGGVGRNGKAEWKQALRELRKNRSFWWIFIMFTTYVGFFNALTSLLNQIMLPYAYTADQAGITGGLLIVIGLLASAIISPLIDRTQQFLLAIRILVPLIGVCFLASIWSFTAWPGNLAPPFIVSAVLGAACFALLPLALEFAVEVTYPVRPEWTSTLLWAGGQLVGAIFLIIMGELKGEGGQPKDSLRRALIFEAVIGMLAVLPVLGLRKGKQRRAEVERREGRREERGEETRV